MLPVASVHFQVSSAPPVPSGLNQYFTVLSPYFVLSDTFSWSKCMPVTAVELPLTVTVHVAESPSALVEP